METKEIRDRTIVLQFMLVKRVFLEERCNKSSFENSRKDARGQGRINESSERRKESVETFHKQGSRNRMKLTSFGG